MCNYFRLLFCLPLLCFQISVPAQADTILARYQRYLYSFPLPKNIPALIASYSPSTQWNDIDYNDGRRANWSLLGHLSRIDELALSWSAPQSPYYHNDTVWWIINSALDHWLDKRYQSSNWWSNEIGVPRVMRDILATIHNDLSPSRLAGAMAVLRQYKVRGTGANLVWSADLGLHDGALTGNDTLIRRCARLIANEIRIDTGDGVQRDYSFHQHGPRLQMYQYGTAFLENNTRIAWQLEGTPWAFTQDKIKILVDFVLNGWQWMARGIQSVPGTMDRSASRLNNLRNADLRGMIPFLCQLYPAKQKELLAVGAFEDGRGEPLEGFRYFPYSDFTAYQTRAGSFFLKTISDRTLPTESINSENLKGKLLNSGDAYVIKNGQEYFNLMPVWDWNKLPGVTSFEGAEKIVRRPFSGSVSDGISGATVMDYSMQGAPGQSLTATKFWACHNSIVVCLIAGLRQDRLPGNAFTSLDQCRRQGAVTITRSTNSPDVLEPGMEVDQSFDSLRWIYHAGLAYIFLQPSAVRLHMGADTGSWRSINVSEPAGAVRDEIFNPVLLHAPEKEPVSSGYVLALCNTPGEAGSIATNPSWEILRNSRDCQAVQFNDGVTLCAFYTAGALTLDGKNKLSVSRPCLILLSGKAIYASDPAHKGNALTVMYNNHPINMRQMPKDGTTIKIN